MTVHSASDANSVLGRLPELLLFLPGMYLCAWWAINLAAGPSRLSMLWVMSGVLCGFLLTSPRSRWPGYLACAFAASVLVNLQRNGLWSLALLLSFGNVIDAWLAASLVTRRIADVSQLANIKRTLWIGGVATLLACTASALVAAIARSWLLPPLHAFDILFETWFASHALGLAIFGTLTVIVRVEGRRILGPPGRRLELVATLLLLVVGCWFTFAQSSLPVVFVVLPLLLLCVLRHRFSGFVPAMAIIALVATMETAAGRGPFIFGAGSWDGVVRTRMLQVFIASCCFLAFPVASVLTELRILSRRVARSELQYRTLAENSRDLVLRIGPGRVVKYISPSVVELLGWEREEFVAQRGELVHPDDMAQLQVAMGTLFDAGGMASALYRCRHKDGHYVWLSAQARSVPADGAEGASDVVFSARDVSKRVEAERALERLARQDALTGLSNRLHFDERIELALARAARNHSRVGLLYFDADHFKTVNDTHGHAAGDEVLREFAQRLQGCIRSVDLAARLGGDEFAILVEDVETPDVLQVIAEKLVVAMRQPIHHGSVELRLTTSVGIALSGPECADPEALMHAADTALYQAKAAGRNTWRMAAV